MVCMLLSSEKKKEEKKKETKWLFSQTVFLTSGKVSQTLAVVLYLTSDRLSPVWVWLGCAFVLWSKPHTLCTGKSLQPPQSLHRDCYRNLWYTNTMPFSVETCHVTYTAIKITFKMVKSIATGSSCNWFNNFKKLLFFCSVQGGEKGASSNYSGT